MDQPTIDFSDELNEKQARLLKIVAGNAALECSRVFMKWVNTDIHVSMDAVEIIPFEEVMQKIGDPFSVSVGLHMQAKGGLEGDLLWLMPEETSYMLIDWLMKKQEGTTQTLDEIGQSALLETANILGCSYLNNLHNELAVRSIPNPPILLHDLTQAILESVLAEQALRQKQALYIEVRFASAGKNIDLIFFFFPVFSSLEGALNG